MSLHTHTESHLHFGNHDFQERFREAELRKIEAEARKAEEEARKKKAEADREEENIKNDYKKTLFEGVKTVGAIATTALTAYLVYKAKIDK